MVQQLFVIFCVFCSGFAISDLDENRMHCIACVQQFPQYFPSLCQRNDELFSSITLRCSSHVENCLKLQNPTLFK